MNDSTRPFINHLFTGIGGYLELTYIDPQSHYALHPTVFSESYKIGEHRIDWQRIADFNRRGYGVYFGLTSKRSAVQPGKRATEHDALWLTCLWAEVDLKAGDYGSIDDITDTLIALPQSPTTIVNSGGGVHAYWKVHPVLINNNNRDGIKRTLRGLSLAIKGDTSVAEMARVFRLPGLTNTKPDRDGAICTITHHMKDIVYRVGAFADYADLATPKRKPVTPSDLPPVTIPGYLKWFLTTAHPDGQRNNRLNWTAYKMWGDGFSLSETEAYLLPRAIACGLPENESLATIRSPYRQR